MTPGACVTIVRVAEQDFITIPRAFRRAARRISIGASHRDTVCPSLTDPPPHFQRHAFMDGIHPRARAHKESGSAGASSSCDDPQARRRSADALPEGPDLRCRSGLLVEAASCDRRHGQKLRSSLGDLNGRGVAGNKPAHAEEIDDADPQPVVQRRTSIRRACAAGAGLAQRSLPRRRAEKARAKTDACD